MNAQNIIKKNSYLCRNFVIPMNKIIGIGNALVDVLVRLTDDEELEYLGLPKGGMMLINDEQQHLLTVRTRALHSAMATGGCAANAVLALANLGAAPGLIGCLGSDDMGDFYIDNCRNAGIEIRFIRTDSHTGVANTFITPDAERTFATCLGAASRLKAEDITAELLSGFQLLHIEGYLVQNYALIEHTCHLAKQMGMTVSMDLASSNVVSEHLDFLRTLVSEYVDIVFANEEESVAFTKGKQPENALKEIAEMADVAVVKLGKYGAMAMKGKEYAFVPGCEVKVVDTTAAGDFFAGGFLYALTHGASVEQCLKTGTLLASHVIQVVGTRLPKSCWQKIIHHTQSILSHT